MRAPGGGPESAALPVRGQGSTRHTRVQLRRTRLYAGAQPPRFRDGTRTPPGGGVAEGGLAARGLVGISGARGSDALPLLHCTHAPLFPWTLSASVRHLHAQEKAPRNGPHQSTQGGSTTHRA